MQDFATITPDQWISNEEACKEQLSAMPSWSQIPLLNSNASHNLPDGSLVRFRGMVQDMFNPEFFFQSFEVFNSVTNDVKVKSGKYRDNSEVLGNEKINYTSNLISAQRQTLVAVSIPGFNKWAQKLEEQQNRLSHLEEHPSTTNPKRSYEEDEAMEVVENKTKEQKKSESTEGEVTSNGDISSITVVSKEHLLNFPLPDVSSKSCIVKIYDEDSTLKVNDMIEVVGFLSKDPSLSGAFQPENNALEPEIESKAELMTHNPPPSLVPRVHAVLVKTLQHCNPLVKEPFDQEAVLQQASVAREHLLKALTELLLGDKLAAEYLICHLIACVYLRQETLTLGSMCLNLSNLPTQRFPSYASQLYDIIQQFVTKSYYLPLTIENMNSMALLPKKDYECNRLTSGVLQLSARTNLVLDETKMQQGRLDSAGVHNIAALGHLIKDQKVEYDFKFYKMEFDADVSVLVLSEGKSLLPSDYHLPLKPEESSLQIFDAIVEAATYYLKEDIMNLIRTYLTNMKMVKYTMSEDLQFVQDDFIAMRAASTAARPVTADDLHRLLVLARLASLSRGHAVLAKRDWDAAVAMERERQARVDSRTAA